MNSKNSKTNITGNNSFPINNYVPRINTIGNFQFPINFQNQRISFNGISPFAAVQSFPGFLQPSVNDGFNFMHMPS